MSNLQLRLLLMNNKIDNIGKKSRENQRVLKKAESSFCGQDEA